MLAISVDRYRAVIFPLHPRPTIRTALLIIAVTWAAAVIASLPVAMFARVTQRPMHDGTLTSFCDEMWPDGASQRYVYSVVVMVLQYLLPLFVLSFTYVHIGVVIWAKRVPGEAENSRDRKLAASKHKVRGLHSHRMRCVAALRVTATHLVCMRILGMRASTRY